MEMWILIWCFSECPTNFKIISKTPSQNIENESQSPNSHFRCKYRWKCEFLSDVFLNVPPISRPFPKTLAKTLKLRAKAQIHIFTANTDGNVNFNLMFFWMFHQFQDHFQKPLAKTLKMRAKAQIHIFTVNTGGNVNFNLMFFWMFHQFQYHFQKP